MLVSCCDEDETTYFGVQSDTGLSPEGAASQSSANSALLYNMGHSTSGFFNARSVVPRQRREFAIFTVAAAVLICNISKLSALLADSFHILS